ncbi:interleukin-18 receptor 1 isoform X2 [Mixophyes fleayi]|uniref:interleukin-18 receptor 1 isoform X2 n=1 Tax=Mixophyes fleayi TaxID=3061075 RepID=UPI003F4E1C9A
MHHPQDSEKLKAFVLNVFEDEYCILKCEEAQKTNTSKFTWYKCYSNVTVNISKFMNRRLIINRDPLEFWPLLSNDSGKYFCTLQDPKYGEKNLSVKMNTWNDCNDSSSVNYLKKNQGASAIIKLPNEYNSSNHSIVWYKNCECYAENVSEISFNSVNHSDASLYTNAITRRDNGQYYNVSTTTKLKVEGKKESVRPKIHGVEKVETREVELGQNLNITCESTVGNPDSASFYWIKTAKNKEGNLGDIFNDCSDQVINTTCITKQMNEKNITCTHLHLININMDDIYYQYKCKLDSPYGGDEKTFVLKLKEKNRDISKRVFATSIIASVTCSVIIVFLVILCIMFRIQIVLLYRGITRLDETIGDGKEYDAYLSFEGLSSPEAEERDFAFQTLAPILENCFGFKLCIFERDGVPGEALVDDMHSLLEKSRRLIIVLSKNYTSGKAMYELESGLHKAMVERKIKVILIEFTPLNEISVLPESLQLLKMRNRVKWEEDRSRPLNSKFWKKIQYLMPAKPVKSNSNFQKLKRMQS